jgi:hypothetical protein
VQAGEGDTSLADARFAELVTQLSDMTEERDAALRELHHTAAELEHAYDTVATLQVRLRLSRLCTLHCLAAGLFGVGAQ